MSETLYTDIRAALSSHLKNTTGIPAVAWEDIEFNPQANVPHLVPNVLWAEGEQAELGATGRNWERGIYQIELVYPTGSGVGAQNAMAGKLRERFKRGTELTYNGVTVKVRKVYLRPNNIVNISFYSLAEN